MSKQKVEIRKWKWGGGGTPQPDNRNAIAQSPLKRFIKISAARAVWPIKILSQTGLKNFYYEVLYQLARKRLLKDSSSDKLIFPLAGITVTERCTLKCKHCAALAQYFEKPRHFSTEEICLTIDAFMEKADAVIQMTLFGGETFMHKGLTEIIHHIIKYKEKYKVLVVLTNGTLVPDEKTLIALKKAKALVRISDYGEKSFKLTELVQQLKAYKIPYITLKLNWQDIAQITDGSDKNAKEKYQRCVKPCSVIMSGKLYQCAFLGCGESLHAYPADKRNYVDLMDESTTKADIKRYFSLDSVPPGCMYCSGYFADSPPVPTAEQISAPLPYKKFE